ncbi:hypothetical protein GCM10009798_27010 [Nocardioides panacihumi]|uniref:Uncharacterized protein n=1 Tax=Nocardioides panacihumi TaxID=400774 RepID=A0ABN2R8E6_9ACTN
MSAILLPELLASISVAVASGAAVDVLKRSASLLQRRKREARMVAESADRVEKLARELQARQAKSDGRDLKEQYLEAVQNLSGSLADTPEAVIRVGNLLLVKTRGEVISRVLTSTEEALLDSHPSIVADTGSALAFLDVRPTN